VFFRAGIILHVELLAGLIIELYPLIRHWPNTRTLDWLNNSVPAQFFYILVAETITIGAIYYFMKRRYRLSLVGHRLEAAALE